MNYHFLLPCDIVFRQLYPESEVVDVFAQEEGADLPVLGERNFRGDYYKLIVDIIEEHFSVQRKGFQIVIDEIIIVVLGSMQIHSCPVTAVNCFHFFTYLLSIKNVQVEPKDNAKRIVQLLDASFVLKTFIHRHIHL